MNSMNLAEYNRQRQRSFFQILREKKIDVAFFEDTEGRRDPSLRYFTGQPSDALLVLTAEGQSILIPWDVNMAQEMATVDAILPYTEFGRTATNALSQVLKQLELPSTVTIELPPSLPYPIYEKYQQAITQALGTSKEIHLLCRENGVHQDAVNMRAIKDQYEINCIKRASAITDNLILLLEEGVRSGTITTEMDAALLIEGECRKAGCEGTGFDTLAAGPERSFGIHCFPPYTAGAFPATGLSILDFGVVVEGYTSDVTLTFAKGPLSPEQEKQLELVQQAYNAALEKYKNGLPIKDAAQIVDDIFAQAGRTMPHSLGHGYGLEAHEWPTVRTTQPPEALFRPGMVVTLEPGLYDTSLGGCRLENDILITPEGNEVLTKARIIRL
ncbi:MAG: aminopeptidase P family protein [Spirochaetaceae bacterium]|nr:aminopeptidase P family protein [Spirochaetaceae bacterium]